MDKYIVLAVSIILIIGIFSFFGIDNEDCIIGYADNVQKTDSGFTFFINIENGKEIKSFYKEKPDGLLHKFFGKYSDDRTIFFVENIADV